MNICFKLSFCDLKVHFLSQVYVSLTAKKYYGHYILYIHCIVMSTTVTQERGKFAIQEKRYYRDRCHLST